LLLGAPAFAAERADAVKSVVVKDPYLELHTGPGAAIPSRRSSIAARA
jgi:hypothetical protein